MDAVQDMFLAMVKATIVMAVIVGPVGFLMWFDVWRERRRSARVWNEYLAHVQAPR
jgi:hypothetical protein